MTFAFIAKEAKVSAFNTVISILGGWLFAEFCGYFLHILLHSEKVPYLSRSHMIHHLRVYGPKKSLRMGQSYKGSVDGRASFLGVGMEWVAPIGLIILVSFGTFELMGISRPYFFLFTGSALVWGYTLFGYMHDAMHLTRFWMEKVPVLSNWFRRIRRLHDIHHVQIADDGRMLTNYGICFFFMDRLFGTLSPKHKPFNESGYEAAERRYADLIGPAK